MDRRRPVGRLGPENHHSTRTVSDPICLLIMECTSGGLTSHHRYLVSFVLLSACRSLGIWSGPVTAASLRQTNFYASIMFILLAREILRRFEEEKSVEGAARTGKQDKNKALLQQVSHVTANVFLFPPFFFFCGLYYTDVISALSVLFAYHFYIRKQRIFLIIAGLSSLFFRQTNIFWMSVFLGGLEVSRTLRKGRSGVDFPSQPTFTDIVYGSWQKSCVYDPLVSQASLEGPGSNSVAVDWITDKPQTMSRQSSLSL
jgi:alpha-1,2-glucosyltransferase